MKKTKKNVFATTTKIYASINKIVFQQYKTFYLNSTKKIKIDDNQSCNNEVDNLITTKTIKQIKFLNAKNTIDTITDQLKKV